MKKQLIFRGLTLSIILIFLVSCQPDENDDNLNDDVRDNLVKTWQCDENSQIYSKSTMTIYTVDIQKDDSSQDDILIYNFYNLGNEYYVKASLSGSELKIIQQEISGHTVNGTGIITNNFKRIDWQYYVDDGSGIDIDTVTAVYIPVN
ncbi:MAG: hypothetical protein Kow0068_18150 [Marinilabiliales bacterium]